MTDADWAMLSVLGMCALLAILAIMLGLAAWAAAMLS